MLDAYWLEWFSLVVRWLHLITGIAWIGASLHFVWLDNSLEEPTDSGKRDGVKGELWSIHGGGIYNFRKFNLAPPSWPSILHWSKWEAYSTWLTGTLLLVGVYYFQAQAYLVGPDKLISDPYVAVLASIGYLGIGLGFYELLVRSPVRHRGIMFPGVVAVFIAAQCWLATMLFSDRAAFIHVGALMGTIMAGNVFLGIIPAQKKFVAAVQSGNPPDEEAALFAKQRSTHNNYFTLPVLFCMISIHYPFLYGHPFNWVILISIIAITSYARHFFNLRHRGVVNYWILGRAVSAFLLLALWLGHQQYSRGNDTEQISEKAMEKNSFPVSDEAAYHMIHIHCAGCHAAQPVYPGFYAPPGGVLMDTRDSIRNSLARSIPAVSTKYMPLGNVTGMTSEERVDLLDWMEDQAR